MRLGNNEFQFFLAWQEIFCLYSHLEMILKKRNLNFSKADVLSSGRHLQQLFTHGLIKLQDARSFGMFVDKICRKLFLENAKLTFPVLSSIAFFSYG